MNLIKNIAVYFGLLICALTPIHAATVSYPFVISDNSGNYVSGATVQIGATVLTAGTPATVNVKALATGSTVSSVSVTYLDFSDGSYVLTYDPIANGEAHVALTVSKSGSVISGANAVLFLNLTADSSLVSTTNTRALLALPSIAPAASGGLPTIGSSAGQIALSSGAVTAGTVNDKTGYALSSGEHTAIGADVLDATTAAHATTGTIGKAIGSAASAGDPWATALPGSYSSGTAGNILGNRIDAAVSSRLASGNVTVGAYATGQDPATLVLDTAASGHNTAGTIGNKISSAASAGDPWTAALPGSYSAGSAGYIVGHNINAQISALPTTSQIAAAILSNPSNLLVTDSSGSPVLSTAVMQAQRDIVWAKVIDGTLNAQDVLVLDAASIVGKVTNTFDTNTHRNTGVRSRQDGTTTAYSVVTQYGSTQTALPATGVTTTVTTPLH